VRVTRGRNSVASCISSSCSGAQAPDQAGGFVGEHGVAVTRTVVDVDQRWHALAAHCVAQCVGHRDGRFGEIHAPAHSATRGNVHERRDFRAEGFTVQRVLHFGVEGVAVSRPHIVRQEICEVATDKRLDVLQLPRAHPATLAGDRPESRQKSTYLVNARAVV
jgi:hypothetical protein